MDKLEHSRRAKQEHAIDVLQRLSCLYKTWSRWHQKRSNVEEIRQVAFKVQKQEWFLAWRHRFQRRQSIDRQCLSMKKFRLERWISRWQTYMHKQRTLQRHSEAYQKGSFERIFVKWRRKRSIASKENARARIIKQQALARLGLLFRRRKYFRPFFNRWNNRLNDRKAYKQAEEAVGRRGE
jgi:hypothetical protein